MKPGDTVSWKARARSAYAYKTKGTIKSVNGEEAEIYMQPSSFNGRKGRRVITKALSDLTLETSSDTPVNQG